ncbi:MAG: aspartyl/glutamyl-tRNA amidotransferase subunit B [Omnitrophica bacterium RIFCSPHIGHO2_02_FULL_46_11]|nr:MAG: aspartyl/glutamyl-tRNA amidotransferase subunit B [Omnitrophica bacterium RIFCSPLOWO2_01_FULL_45_10b]OGW86498.1 MAG: aspartyl/glutamyl-tRNA amidotransferase subunit B [Omnitrophica bacterium RIFCSPHIGHO2_02_FULL_46_11]
MSDQYESVIGLEVHVQLKTESKIFCSCPAQFGAEPNQNTCPVCLGLPGSLPVLNERALELAMKVGLALGCRISDRIKFDRKNYFYPDLPKAYQISQYDMPVSSKGHLAIELKSDAGTLAEKRIGITRAHLEEDAGKLLHEGVRDGSWVDYNRAGIPLLEIVSEPDLRSPEEAFQYLVSLKAILQYLGVSDCNMEEGSLRCDANVSIRQKGAAPFGTKVEIKNMNSFRAVHKAIAYEIKRQSEALETGTRIVQETRLWNESKGETFTMRSKEEAHDYRYFPEPDLVPFSVSSDQIEALRKSLPELPQARFERFRKQYGISDYDAYVLVAEKALADYFEACTREGANPKLASNWIQSELLALINLKKHSIKNLPNLPPKHLAGLIRLIENGTISGKIAKDVIVEMYDTKKSAEEIVKEKGLIQVTDTKLLEEVADRVIQANPKVAAEVRSGKAQAIGFLVGQVMKETQGKANPKMINEILTKKITSQK